MAAGATPKDVAARRAADLPDVPDVRRCLELRGELGIAHDDDSPAFVLPNGDPVAAKDLTRWLRTARLIMRGEVFVPGNIWKD